MVVWVGGIDLHTRLDSMKAWVVAGMELVVETPHWNKWSVVLRTQLAVPVVRIQQECAFESSGCLQLRREVENQRSHHSRPMSGRYLRWSHYMSWCLVHRMKTSALV